VLLEAWANRVPVLAADIGALRTLVREGIDGLLVPPSQPVALAKAMRRLMDDPALVSRLGMQGRARVDDMTWERLAQRFEQLVESLLEERMAIGKRQ
jgi:D-inositol-3-phosphate glycosyltransferase